MCSLVKPRSNPQRSPEAEGGLLHEPYQGLKVRSEALATKRANFKQRCRASSVEADHSDAGPGSGSETRSGDSAKVQGTFQLHLLLAVLASLFNFFE